MSNVLSEDLVANASNVQQTWEICAVNFNFKSPREAPLKVRIFVCQAPQPYYTMASGSRWPIFDKICAALGSIRWSQTNRFSEPNTSEKGHSNISSHVSTSWIANHYQRLGICGKYPEEKLRTVLGHIIRRSRNHPQQQAAFATRNLLPQQVENRRVGRPRAEWTHETMKDCWRRKFPNIRFQTQNKELCEQIKTWAINREDPFWQAVVVPTGLTQTYGLDNKCPSTERWSLITIYIHLSVLSDSQQLI